MKKHVTAMSGAEMDLWEDRINYINVIKWRIITYFCPQCHQKETAFLRLFDQALTLEAVIERVRRDGLTLRGSTVDGNGNITVEAYTKKACKVCKPGFNFFRKG